MLAGATLFLVIVISLGIGVLSGFILLRTLLNAFGRNTQSH